jgi:integrase
MFLLGLDLGARVSEIAGLRWDCINWTNKFVTVWDEKKDCWRTCTLSPDTWGLLKAKKDRADMRTEKLVFPISHKTFNRRIKAWAVKAGMTKYVRWHTLRHTYVIQARRAGRDWNEISQQTGDTLETLVGTYGSLSIEDRVEMTEKKPLIPGLSSTPKNDAETSGGNR